MHLVYWILGVALGAVWLHRIGEALLGMRAIPDIARPEWDRAATGRVAIVVPARNEEKHVEEAVGSLLRLDYPDYEVIAVNDRSEDRTGEILDRLAGASGGHMRVVHVEALPPGWLGKTHAMWSAARQATSDWILFTDADIVFRPDALRRALGYAAQAQADHVVLFPTQVLKTVGERMMIAFFSVLFVFGHRPWKVADPKARDHMGVGAFNLVRRRVYEAVGGYERLRLAVIDDMKLGQIIKQAGYAQRNVLGNGLITLRWATSAMGVVHNLTKNMFALMQYRWPRALGATFLLMVLNLGPFVGVWFAPGWARLGFGAALAGVLGMYIGIFRETRKSKHSVISPAYFFLHPVATLMYAYLLLRSMTHALWHGGVIWRGTKYPLRDLRDNFV